jgi:hypothetical protein
MRGPGGALSCLLNPLQLRFEPAEGSAAEVEGAAELAGMFEPIASTRELEQFVLRRVRCTAPRYVDYCRRLVGCRVEEKAAGFDNWRGARLEQLNSV